VPYLNKFILGENRSLTTTLIVLIYKVPKYTVFDLKALASAGDTHTRIITKVISEKEFTNKGKIRS
jgi:hypothetical protein